MDVRVPTALFRHFDVDGSDFLGADELYNGLDALRTCLPDTCGGSFSLEALDTDGDGRVSLEEWLEAFRTLRLVVGPAAFDAALASLDGPAAGAGLRRKQTPRIAPKAQAAAKAVAKAPAAKVRPQAPGRQSQQTPRMAPKAPSASKATPVAPPERGEAHRLLWTLTSSI